MRVVLVNKLPEATTIHWHGLPVDPDMDGVPGLSQPAVPPGRAFVYTFVASDPGTYIYHTHFDDFNQLDRGLYGAVVVDDAKPSERFDRDYLMLLSSWRIYSDTENFFSINGKSYPLTKPFMVKRGDRVRVREIDISGTEFHTMHLHGHHFQVIAYDGQPVAAANRQRMVTLTIGPGETRDIAFTANAKPGTWMFHCHVADHMMNGSMGPGGLVTAVQYEGAPNKLAALATQDVMGMNPGGGGGGGSSSVGAPLPPVAVYVLGAIAGLTIFFGLPFAALRQVPARGIAFLNATAVGVLFFLLFDILRQAGEPVQNALHQVQLGAPKAGFLILTATYLVGLAVGLLSLVFFARGYIARRSASGALTPLALASIIAAGIGLHNFSEGLAIGQSAATGAVQLAFLLIIGFGLHNMTEGFGIAAPLAGSGGATLGADRAPRAHRRRAHIRRHDHRLSFRIAAAVGALPHPRGGRDHLRHRRDDQRRAQSGLPGAGDAGRLRGLRRGAGHRSYFERCRRLGPASGARSTLRSDARARVPSAVSPLPRLPAWSCRRAAVLPSHRAISGA